MIETLEAWIGFILVLVFFAFLTAGIFMRLGTKILKIKYSNLKKTFLSSLIISLMIYTATLLFAALPHLSTVLSFLLALLLSMFVIKIILRLNYGKAFLLWIFNGAGQILAVLIGTYLFIGGLKDLIGII